MEKEKSYTGLTIRIPANIAKELKELKDGQDLSSYGLALQYWVRQQQDEEIQSRLIDLEEKIKEVGKLLHTTMAIVIKTNWKMNILAANPDARENKEGEVIEISELLKEIDGFSPKQVWEKVLAKK